jgi:hypothetical protein
MTKKPDFEACLEVLETPAENALAGDLSSFIDDDESDLPKSEQWQEHWKGMPDFEQENKKPYKKLNVCFKTKKDFEDFRKLMEQPMTEKTKTIWYPAFDREANSLFSWVEDDK